MIIIIIIIIIIGSFSAHRMFFEPHTSTGCGVFAILGRVFDHFFSANRFLERKDTKEYKFDTIIKAF